jgi:carbamoyl-phosphate synthase large subunit
MINILVTGAGGGVGQGIIKSLHLIRDLDIFIVAADMSELATGLYAGNRSYLVPGCNAKGYIERLEEIFDKDNIDFYFPGTDVELYFCAENKEYLEDKFDIKVVVSKQEAIEIADDKYQTYQFLKKNGLAHPQTLLPSEVTPSLTLPTIVKPAIGCRSIGVSVEKSIESVMARLNKENGLVVQELIGCDDSEFTCTVVKVNDDISEVLILKRVLRSGDTYRAEPVESKIIADYVKLVAIKLDIEGSCNFQLRVDKDGIPKIFEINCRYSGTTPFCAQLGFNPVEFYLKRMLGLKYEYSIDYDSIVLRYWAEVLVNKNHKDTLGTLKTCTPIYNKKIDLFDVSGN